MRYGTAIVILILVTIAQAQQVNPEVVLKECTDAKATCRETTTTCTDIYNKVNELFSWTGIKILLGVGLIIMATWFIIFSLGAIYRYLNDIQQRRQKTRYVDQLEHTNKILLELGEKLQTKFTIIEEEIKQITELRQKLQEQLRIQQTTNTQIPDHILGEQQDKPAENKKTSWLNQIGYMLITLAIAVTTILIIYYNKIT